jgi:hypothetical protein
MANVDRPYGFVPVNFRQGMHYVTRYRVATGAGAMAKGDLVDAQSGGTVDRAAAGSTTIVGVVMRFEWVDAYGKARWGTYYDAGASDTLRYAYVIDDPRVSFRAQSQDAAVASQLTDVFNNVDHLDTAPTQTDEYAGHSNHEIDLSSLTTDEASLRLEDRYLTPSNKFGSSTTDNLHGQYVCRIVEHFNGPIYTMDTDHTQLVPVPGV